MTRPSHHDILFEPVTLGPVTARNRFYQAPHCNGMGRNYPTPMAEMRGTKAEGGWSVVFTELADIHHSSDSPRNVRLWDERDFPILGQMVDKVQKHGSLAGIQLSHLGYVSANLIGRETPISPSSRASYYLHPSSSRGMSLTDIRAYRRWHRRAALNAKAIGYDIVMIYAAHDMGLPMHFLSRKHNQRTDDYGGCLENRARLLRELIEETKDAVGDRCAVGVRLCVDELAGPDGITCDGEGRDILAHLAELPDYWDLNIGKWPDDSGTSRFHQEAYQEPYIEFAKSVTTKPVVGVGRFTSPDTMAAQIRRGTLDMIGAARPSIADPFLPRKVEEGRPEDIRECIGCNICITNNHFNTPIRCTQNPTMGEEWRRGWHPERVEPKSTDDRILIVGSGPAGLEAARVLGLRGYDVVVAERSKVPGGRVTQESGLPGLNAWARVRDYRLQQLHKLANVQLYLESEMTALDVRESECSLVAIAAGARWRQDGTGKLLNKGVPIADHMPVLTPDDIMSGDLPAGTVAIWDDDHYYMGSVIAERLVEAGCTVVLVTPESAPARFAEYTLESGKILKRLLEIDVNILSGHSLVSGDKGVIDLSCVHTGKVRKLECDALVMVAGREPDRRLYSELQVDEDQSTAQRIVPIGDCWAPGTIAAAVYSGHRFGRDLTLDLADETPFLREDVQLFQ